MKFYFAESLDGANHQKYKKMENQSKNKSISFAEEVLGIKLHEPRIYVANRKVVTEAKVENGVSYPLHFEFTAEPKLPEEWEKYLPQRGMDPVTAFKQLEVCQNLVFGQYGHISKIYALDVRMSFLQTAILNCIFLLSEDFDNWTIKNSAATHNSSFIKSLEAKVSIFESFFSSASSVQFYTQYINNVLLYVLIANKHLDVVFSQSASEYENPIYFLLYGSELHKINQNFGSRLFIVDAVLVKCKELTNHLLMID
jgi:hypothetical protein